MITFATKTLEAINAALEKDSGYTFRLLLAKELRKFQLPEPNSGPRTYLGASIIGEDCDRKLWYGFRWAKEDKFDGRMIRLFQRGELEEPRFYALLKMIGCQVWATTANGKQYRFKEIGGHFGGGCDGIALGIPDNPDEPVLLEFKTYNEKQFTKLVKEGVRSFNFKHWVQMQVYMGGLWNGKSQIKQALYLAVNKNDDTLYGELIEYDVRVYEANLRKASNIIFAEKPPAKINESPGWWQCKFCNFHDICHLGKPILKTCRSCVNVLIKDDGTWHCKLNEIKLSRTDQLKGCEQYEIGCAELLSIAQRIRTAPKE
jgi:hypothetical protein